jgi:hypothetical protein
VLKDCKVSREEFLRFRQQNRPVRCRMRSTRFRMGGPKALALLTLFEIEAVIHDSSIHGLYGVVGEVIDRFNVCRVGR